MKKKILSVLLSAVMVLSMIQISPIDAEAASDSDGVVYKEIYTALDLYNVRDDLGGNYKLMNDIDLTDFVKEGFFGDFMGNGWNPIGSTDRYYYKAFTGEFDGQGYTISGLNINLKNYPSIVGGGDSVPAYAYLGLFSKNSGEIRNLNIVCDIKNVRSTKAGAMAGGIAAINDGKIINCIVAGNINVVSGKTKDYETHYSKTYYYKYFDGTAGGIVGNNTNGIIEKCVNYSDIEVDDKEGQHGARDSGSNFTDYYSSSIGGICGLGGNIKECFNVGNLVAGGTITTGNSIGGISSSSKIVTDSYNIGTITGGIANKYGISGSGTITYCYNCGELIGTNNIVIGG